MLASRSQEGQEEGGGEAAQLGENCGELGCVLLGEPKRRVRGGAAIAPDDDGNATSLRVRLACPGDQGEGNQPQLRCYGKPGLQVRDSDKLPHQGSSFSNNSEDWTVSAMGRCCAPRIMPAPPAPSFASTSRTVSAWMGFSL